MPRRPRSSGRLSTQRLKRRVHMQNTVDAALLGGAVIRAGDLVIDGSLKGRLERLRTELTELALKYRRGARRGRSKRIDMSIKASEISDLIKARIEKFQSADRGAQCRHGGERHRRHRAHPRPCRRALRRNARVRRQHLRARAEPRAGLGRRGGARRLQAHLGRPGGQDHRPHPRGAGGPGTARPRGRRARHADRRQGPDQRQAEIPARSAWRRA